MDDAERQRTMDFILQQMAQVSASMQRNEEESLKRNQRDARRDVSITQIRKLLARTIWERRRDRRDWNERMAALVNAQMRSDEARSRLDEKMNALVDAQIRSEDAQVKSDEKQSRTDEWQARMEESFAPSDARMTRLEEEAERNGKDMDALLQTTERNSEAIAKLTESQDRNSEAIAKLTDVVAGQNRPRSSDNS